MLKLAIRGDVAIKTSGEYANSLWRIVAFFETFTGKERVIAESIAVPGLLHIFTTAQLELHSLS